ncbi:SusC/RagA family TonB-linked outer membrane protein [Elizabethkingia sp. JS20170427COW]|uniref:SusC/RagA family TonB-linked outer membrane protein n=1 Tax=Elizabethkingia sp. JS20170427COW TaxID=2583851 RepID=UPI0021065A06|nr:SusC/RagA family TonB-linked outer membrane protein [Elizabethkingia sp. JS20170427COW]
MTRKLQILSAVGVSFFLMQSNIYGQRTKASDTLTKENNIDEVVVVGYKKQRKETLTTSVAAVDGDKLKDVTSANFQNALQGKLPGVTVAISSGQPGSKPTIRVRGITSFGASNDPLYVVDGVIQHGDGDVPPDQIESITVLKDTAATTLYGARGAAGVIVITTKSGRGSSFNVNVTNTYNFFNMGNFKVMNSQQQKERFMEFAKNGADLSTILGNVSGGVVTNLDQIHEDFDWFKVATQVGEVKDASVSFSKSKEGSKTYIVAGYYNEKGTVKGYEFDRISARLNHETDVKPWLKVSPKLFFKYDKVDNRSYSLFDGAMKMPWDSPYFNDGSLKNVIDNPSIVWFSRDRDNYLYDRDLYYSNSNVFQGQGNLDFEVKLTDKLKFISTNGLTYYNSDGFSYSDPSAFGSRSESVKGTMGSSTATRWTKYTNQMLRYENEWGKHRFNGLVAFEYMDYMYKGFSANTKKIIPGMEILGGAEANGAPRGTKNEYAFQSILSNFDYSYDDRYMLQASLRTDESSKFSPKYSRGWFWGVSAGWNVHNEAFFQNLTSTINKFKLRGSYGTQGNTPSEGALGDPALYGPYSMLTQSNYLDEVALITWTLANNTLKWETVKQLNLGLDASLLRNRVNVVVDWYNKDTHDLITTVPLSYITGFSDKLSNVGMLRNRGIEIAVDADVIRKPNLTWNVGINFSKNKTTFEQLYLNDQITGNYIRREGERYLTYRMKEWAGVDVATGDPLWYVVNADGSRTTTNNWNKATYQVLDKSRLPDFNASFNTSLTYKGFTLSANVYVSVGGYIYNSERSLMDSDGIYPFYNQMVFHKDWIRWEKGDPNGTNNVATHPSLIYNDGRKSNQASTRYLEDGTFVKIRNISLAYNLPKEFLPGNVFKSVKVFMNLDNFFRFSKFSGMDPEVGMTEDAYYKYPVPKSVSMGMNVTF